VIAGVDVGYGYTKAANAAGCTVTFPSVVTRPSGGGELTRVLGGSALPHRLTVRLAGGEAQTYLVGNAALFAGGTRTWDARADRRHDYPPLVLASLALLGAFGDVSLGLGLPLQLYTAADDRRALRARLAGVEAILSVDGGGEAALRIRDVRVFPQSVAAYFAQVRSDPTLARRPCAVVDVGYRTTDHLVMRLAPGETVARPDERLSGSLDLGVERVYAQVAQALSRRHGAMIETNDVEQAAVAGRDMTVGGREVALKEAIDEAARDLVVDAAARLRESWGAALDQLGAVLLAGGGGAMLRTHFAEALPGVRLVTDPVMANAHGYAAMMERLAASAPA